MDKTQKNLQELGLTPNEALVYLANLELGPATAQQIAAKAAVVRPTAYVAIGGLVKRGLVSQFKKGKKVYSQAEKPERLAHLIEVEKREIIEREAKLKEIMPMLASLVSHSGDKPEVKYYEGTEGLEAMREILMNSGAKEMDIVTTNRHALDERGLIKNAMHFRYIIVIPNSEKNKDATKETKGKTTFDFRFVRTPDPKDFGEISVLKNHVALIVNSEKPYGFLVKSKQIANTARAMFEAYWQSIK